MSPSIRKRTFGHVYPAKIKIRLRSESSFGAFWIDDETFLHVDNEDVEVQCELSIRWRIFEKICFLTMRPK